MDPKELEAMATEQGYNKALADEASEFVREVVIKMERRIGELEGLPDKASFALCVAIEGCKLVAVASFANASWCNQKYVDTLSGKLQETVMRLVLVSRLEAALGMLADGPKKKDDPSMFKFKVTGVSIEQFVKRMFYLAWQASSVVGMEALHNRGEQDEETVWKNVFDRGDYPRGNTIPGFANKPGMVHGNYVFGRMMKLNVRWGEDGTITTTDGYRWDCQSFCRQYQTPRELAIAAQESLVCEGLGSVLIDWETAPVGGTVPAQG